MKVIVCDASPLIFLAKLNLLHLIDGVLGKRIHVLQCVVDEACSERSSALETSRLQQFFKTVQIVDCDAAGDGNELSALSTSDQATLHWAISHHADLILVDERLLRRVALENGIEVVGFLGVLVAAARSGLLPKADAKDAIDTAVSAHHCQISIALYQRIIMEIESI